MVQLFCFSSINRKNITVGIEARLWAVANVSPAAKGKARRHFRKGSLGILYCSEGHFFTTPFIATSAADPGRRVDDVWDEPWYLPFGINPLGNLQKQMSKDLAKVIWRADLMRYVSPVTVFSPIEIDDADWQSIQHSLANLAQATID